MMVYKIEFYAYLPEMKIYFFFILIQGRIRIFFSAEPDPDPPKKMLESHP